ncbi:MAG TPA: enoyl-CoA hydratase-related protein [Thermoanaerobaculia bacterium]|nr:enoyl-CoA hydratase-related protein [Thermoanaerobaculia bacterium]
MTLILLDIQDRVATITLNRPEKLNAFFGTMREELIEVLDHCASAEEVRAIMVTGAGRGFSAGGDVEFMKALQADRNTDGFRKLLDAGRRIVMTLHEMPKPVLAAVNGVAAGAGCNLALACDLRIASEQARFTESFVRIGLHPDWGGTWFLPRLVGPSRALDLLMTGRVVEAKEALEMGLVERVVPADCLLEEARALALFLASGPPLPLAAIKRAVAASTRNDLSAQLELESEHQLRAFLTGDAAEGMSAFSEKRRPDFKGR